jgi:hypothetical protein
MSLLGSISQFFGSEPVTAGLGVYDPKSGGEQTNSSFDFVTALGGEDTKKPSFTAFQYFPERISDTKSANYSTREVPGASHPLYTFINGGARIISFDAIFCSDERPEEDIDVLGALQGLVTVERRDTVDIAAAIAWLRQYLYPKYESNIAKNPDLLVVYLPNSGIVGSGAIPGSIVGIMTRCDVAYEAFHRNGKPRIAVASLEFHEIVQTRENWQYFGASNFKKTAGNYKKAMTEG